MIFRTKLILSCLIISCCLSCNEGEVIEVKNSPALDESIGINENYSSVGKLLLSEYGFFNGKMADLNPADRLFKYELNTPLFTDYASKARFIYLPEGTQISYQEETPLEFPIGSVLIKNFYYSGEELGLKSKKIIETRLLIHEESGWVALPYIWNKDQSEAFLEITGGDLFIDHQTHGKFTYAIPTMNQCKSCHETSGKITPIGPTVRQLNREGQMERMLELAFIDSLAPQTEMPQLAQWDNNNESLDNRARAYLDINCAHCHRDNGPAKNSGLSLMYNETDPYSLGIKKRPVAAGKGSGGFSYDIDPGNAEESILVHRMTINDPGTRMPELGRNLVHKEGVALIKEWINSK